jgi:uncharacterized phiE125 gp8 family phage protein
MRVISPTNYTVSIAATVDPVTVEEAKVQLRVESDDYDAEIRKYIASATDYLQTVEDRQFVTATLIAKIDCFPSGAYDEIRLAKSPLATVTEITYIDADSVVQTWASSNYRVDTNSEPGRITLASGCVWPTPLEVSNAISITFTAGQSQANVPQRIKQHILMLVSEWWWNRETSVELNSKESHWHSRLLWANRVKQFV